MFCAHKRLCLGVFALVIASILFVGFLDERAFAHTVTLSTSGTVNLEVSPAGVGNSNGASLGVDTLEVTSTCPLGYTVTISGPTDSTLYKNGESTNNVTNQKITASTGTSTNPASILGDNLGTWGYALGVNPTTGESTNITTSSNFIGLNGTNTTLITKSSASGNGDEVTTDTYPVYYGTSVSSTHEPGLYKLAESSEGAADNVITYYLTANANCNTYKIRYNDNGANSATTMTGMTQPITEGTTTTVDLAPSNYQRTGYGFAGWSTEQLNPDANNFSTLLATAKTNGHIYGPMETITVDNSLLEQATVDNGEQVITMYALWVKSQGNLQAWTGCDSMSTGALTALTDTRDSNTYAVAKLADGKCWMIENLRLADKTSNNVAIGLSSTNTHVPSLPLTNTWWTTSANNSDTKPTSNSLSSPVTPSSTTPWCNTDNANCDNQSMLATNNTSSAITNQSNNSSNIYSYGNYYNWYSATAGNGTYSTQNNIVVGGDLCPSGWHLPKGGNSSNATNNDFWQLGLGIMGNPPSNNSYYKNETNTDGKTATMAIRSFPNNFLYSGYVNGSSVYYRGSYGRYWSSTAYNNSDAHVLYLNSSSVGPAARDYKYYGLTIRCLASGPSYTVKFDVNGGTGMMSAQIVPRDVATALTNNTFTAPTGRAFVGWNTAADGSGTSYANGESVTNIAPLFGSITLYAQWVCPANRVCFNDNGANSSTKMGNRSISASATTVVLWPSNFQRAGYGFAGWSTEKLDADAADFQTKLTTAKNAGHVYGPMETITITAGQYSTLGLQLYAIWVPSAGNLQGWTGCSSLAQGAVTALKDTRDNNVYAVAKLADNKCWMIENLRLNNTPTLTTSNTNNPSLPLTNTWYTSDTIQTTKSTSNKLSTPVTPSSSTPWCTADNANCIDQSMLATNNTSSAVANQSNNSSNIYSYGNYYNWYSATAGNGTYSKSSGNTAGDLCPSGWHLPTGTGSGEFRTLNAEANAGAINTSLGLRTFPNNFLYPSRVNSGSSIYYRGSDGYYWSSTAHTSDSAYALGLDSSSVSPGTNINHKYYGLPIRCLAGS